MNNCKTCGKECNRIFCSVTCSNKHWNPLTKESRKKLAKKADEIITHTGTCNKCGVEFTVTRERKKLRGKNIPKYCSRECANSRSHSDETKLKIQNSVRLKHPDKIYHNDPIIRKHKVEKTVKPIKYCGECGNIVLGRNSKLFCSHECAIQNRLKEKRNEIAMHLLSGKNYTNTNNLSIVKETLIHMRGHQCERCKETVWMGEPIPLVLDHINGRSSESTLTNLRLICANCDRQTDTYGSKNKNSDRRVRKEYYKKFYSPVSNTGNVKNLDSHSNK